MALSTTIGIDIGKAMTAQRPPIHPGEILGEELIELEMSAAELAKAWRVPTDWVTQIVSGKRAITADTASRLGEWFGTGQEFWLNLQKSFEMRLAEQASNEV
jgi:addiction module HigA family antidote